MPFSAPCGPHVIFHFFHRCAVVGYVSAQVMIYNLARSRDKIDALLQTCTASACVNGVIGTLQICGYTLNRYDCIPDGAVLVTPLYKGLDKFVYTHLPFAISTKTFDSRASGTFSNPNLLATHMVIAYPISIYLFLNAKTKSRKCCAFLPMCSSVPGSVPP